MQPPSGACRIAQAVTRLIPRLSNLCGTIPIVHRPNMGGDLETVTPYALNQAALNAERGSLLMVPRDWPAEPDGCVN
jgi:hypothetical protein